MIKSMPGFVSPNAPPSLLLVSSTEQLFTLLMEGTLFLPIHLLLGTIRTISPPANSTLAEFYTEPESDSELEEDIGRPPKRRRAFPKSHNRWQKRILSNDRKVVRLQNHSRELISRARVKQGEAYMGRYAGLNIPSVALPPGVPPPGCEAPLVNADVESEDSDSSDDDNDGN